MSGTASLFFSPTGTTRKIVRAFAEGYGGPRTENDISLPVTREKPLKNGGADDLFVFAGPVYGGRSFKLLTKTIGKLDGGGRPAVCIAVYGGRHYDMALADLYEAAADAGFRVIACGAFIGEHSFSSAIQTGRPDKEDLALAMDFGRQVRERAEAAKAAGKDLPAMAPEDVPKREVDLAAIGMHRERLGRLSPNRPFASENCIRCGTCAAVCPLGLIDRDNPEKIEEKCIKCGACVKACPVGAMRFPQEDFKEVAKNCEETFGKEERSPQIWFAE